MSHGADGEVMSISIGVAGPAESAQPPPGLFVSHAGGWTRPPFISYATKAVPPASANANASVGTSAGSASEPVSSWRALLFDTAVRGLMATLPWVLFVSFCLVVGTSSVIFSAWSCQPYEVNDVLGTSQEYLRADPSVRCSMGSYVNSKYEEIRSLGFFFFWIWPIGLPLMYIGLILPCRSAITQNRQTQLRRATSFLHREYKPSCYYWEVLVLVQRLALSGFMQLVPDEIAFIRILCGLMITFVYLVLLQIMRPYRREDLSFIAVASQFALSQVFLGATCLELYQHLWQESETIAARVLGFTSEEQIVLLLLIFNFAILAMVRCTLIATDSVP